MITYIYVSKTMYVHHSDDPAQWCWIIRCSTMVRFHMVCEMRHISQLFIYISCVLFTCLKPNLQSKITIDLFYNNSQPRKLRFGLQAKGRLSPSNYVD